MDNPQTVGQGLPMVLWPLRNRVCQWGVSEPLLRAMVRRRWTGVYFLAYCDEVVYVGQGNNVATRVLDAIKRGDMFDRIWVADVPNFELDLAEARYIHALAPRYNKAYPRLRNYVKHPSWKAWELSMADYQSHPQWQAWMKRLPMGGYGWRLNDVLRAMNRVWIFGRMVENEGHRISA